MYILLYLPVHWRDLIEQINFFDSDFTSPCLDVPKASNFTAGRVQNRETKNRRLGTIVMSFQDFELPEKQISPTFSYFLIRNAPLYHFLANWLAHNEKMTEKSVFCKAWSPEMTSQSFPVSCFWSRGFVPHQKCNLMLLVHQNMGRENRYQKFFFGIHISTGDLIEQIKKMFHSIHFLMSSGIELHNFSGAKEKALAP